MERIKEQVAALLGGDVSGHGMDHVERVLRLSRRFAVQEGADVRLASLIALLHDVDDYKLFGAENAESLTNTRTILTRCEVDAHTQELVCEALRTIGYSKRLKGLVPATLEGRVVSDADMCDAVGANGLLRVHAYSMKNGKPFFDRAVFPAADLSADSYTRKCADSSVCHIFEKLLRLRELMLTASGKAEIEARHRLTVAFLYQLFSEEDAPEWADYLNRYLAENQ